MGLLVISRKIGQHVYIGGTVRVTLIDINRNKVRFGIEAPREVEILRGELVDHSPREADEHRIGNAAPASATQRSDEGMDCNGAVAAARDLLRWFDINGRLSAKQQKVLTDLENALEMSHANALGDRGASDCSAAAS